MRSPTLFCLLGTLVQLSLFQVCGGFGFLAPVGVAVGSVVWGTFCKFRECCSEIGIPADFRGMKKDFKERLYGQHLVEDIVLNALRSHWSSTRKSPKALTLSFHGWPGGGKNYVAKIIVDNLYAAGAKSRFVHHYIGRIHFPLQENVGKYQAGLYDDIRTNVSACPRQVFIFDEVDKIPPKVLNILKPMIDYRDEVDGIDYRESIFIFLSNTGANLINKRYLDLWVNDGRKREDLKLTDFESLIAKGSFNEEGGFHHSDTIQSNLIDHYVPFLPMERRHVRLCIIDEFKQREVMNPKEEHIMEAMDFIDWGPSSHMVFSTTGCKRVSQKVGAIVAKYYKLPHDR